MTDYYATLGIQHTDSMAVIKDQYRKLVKQNHPDIATDKVAAEKRMQEINEAWEVLSDEKKRAAYDETRANAAGAGNKTKKSKSGSAHIGEAEYNDLMGKFDSFFGKSATSPAAQKNQKNPLDAGDLFEKFMGIKRK